MWIEKSGNKLRACTTYTDPLTGARHKIGVTIDKDTPQQRNKAGKALDALVAQKQAYAPEHTTLKHLTELYIADQRLTLKESTCHRNEHACKAMRIMFGDDCDVNKLTAGIVKQRMIEYRNTRAAKIKDKERREKAEKSVTLVNELIARFKALMRWAYRNDYVRDVAYLDKLNKLKDRTKREKVVDKFLEASECETLIDAMPEQWKDLTRFLILSGLRIGEALALNESDIDLVNREITVNKTLDLVNGIVTDTKTLASTRVIDMQPELYALSRAVLASNRRKRKILYIHGSYMFFDLTGSRAPYDAFRKCLRENSERVIGRKITPHTLRHTHASLLAEQGFDYEEIARRLGHEDSRITKEIYIHFTEKRREKEKERYRKLKLI